MIKTHQQVDFISNSPQLFQEFLMAAKFLCLISLFIVSCIPQCVSQSNSPQNIQTFYPFSPPPAISIPPPRRSKSSMRAAVGKAIAVTAASTLVLCGLLFFMLLRHLRGKRERDVAITTNVTGLMPQNENSKRFDGNVEGLIVDENGLDMLYLRNLEEGENRRSFKKQHYRSLRNDQKEEEKRMVEDGGRRYEPPVQEVPLLRRKSSTSQSPMWGEKDHVMKRETTLSSEMAFEIEEKQDSSVQCMKNPPPPLPPPPPPPRPSPPPMPSNEGPTPVGASASSFKPPAPNGTPSNGQVKLKPLHWDEVNPNVEQSMVWSKIDKGSFKFDGDLVEALFGYVATNRRSTQRNSLSASPQGDKPGPPSQIFILDPHKSQSTAIVLKSLGVTRKEIIDALVEGRGLNAETLEKLTRIAPADEETSEILAFDGDPTRLADAESFLYHLLKSVQSAFARFRAMLFRSNYDLEASRLKESLESLELACEELKTRGLFLKLLEAVLKAGNRLNGGTSRGNAQAFNLSALRKLSDVKSSDGKTTLLQFVVQEVVLGEGKRCVINRNRSLSTNSGTQGSDNTGSEDDREREYMMLGLPVVGGLSAEFSNVKKAATLDYDLLVKATSALVGQAVEIRKVLEQCGADGGFQSEMKGFLDTAELDIKALKEEQTRVMEVVKKTTDYYQTGSSKDKGVNALQLFVIVRDFLAMVDHVCIEIARNLQKKPASSVAGSASPVSPRVLRFPRLPVNFLSDNSSSSSGYSYHDSKESS